MEPLHPKLKDALKRAHPGLTDEDIDRSEGLLVRQLEFDPDKDADKIKQIDREWAALIQRRMPLYQAVVQSFKAESTRPKRRSTPKVKIKRQRRR